MRLTSKHTPETDILHSKVAIRNDRVRKLERDLLEVISGCHKRTVEPCANFRAADHPDISWRHTRLLVRIWARGFDFSDSAAPDWFAAIYKTAMWILDWEIRTRLCPASSGNPNTDSFCRDRIHPNRFPDMTIGIVKPAAIHKAEVLSKVAYLPE